MTKEQQEQYNLLSEKLHRLKMELIIETDAADKFKLEKQIEVVERQLQEYETGVTSPPTRPSRSTANGHQQVKILFLAANPIGTGKLRLDEEIRSIDTALIQATYRDQFELIDKWAVRISDVQHYLLRYQPHIVHFSGHGSKESEIILEKTSGKGRSVPREALSQLFSILKDNIRCVVLNACYSEEQAKAIAEYIECVVGMNKAVGDSAAINFAASFYQGLAYGRDIQTAFDLGCNQIDLGGLPDKDTPQLLTPNCDPTQIKFV